jgi:hypothetical protein
MLEGQKTGGRLNPIILLGILVIIVPIISRIAKFKLPGWISTIGIVILIIGVIISAFDR